MSEQENYRPPTEREAEGIRQFLKMVMQLQTRMQEQDPERFQQMLEATRNKGQQR